MEFRTKYSVGDTVYEKKCGKRNALKIDEISISICESKAGQKAKAVPKYKCGGKWFVENALSHKKPLTKEEQAREEKRMKIHNRLKNLACEYEFISGEINFFVDYDEERNRIKISSNKYIYDGARVYFESWLDAEKAVRRIGEDALILDYFRKGE